MTTAIAYGGALALSGWFLSRGVELAQRDRWLERLGASPPSRRSTTGPIASIFAPAAAARSRLVVVGAAILGAASGHQLVGIAGVVVGSIAGPLVVRGRRAQRSLAARDLLDRQLGEAIVAIAAAVRAGLSVRRAVAEAARDADLPLRGELEAVVSRLETGEPLEEALARLGRRLRLSDARLVVTALGVHRRTGGDLPGLLDGVGQVIRARLEDRRSIRALTMQSRSSGVVLAVLPVAFVALLSGTSGDGLGAFYRSPSGAALLLVGFCCQALGFAWMRRIVKRVEAV